MSLEVVKKQLLCAITALNLPLDSTPSTRRVNEACAAAKLLRNRLLREHSRVEESIEELRQRQMYDEDSEDEDENENDPFAGEIEAKLSKGSRNEFIFLAELRIVEKLVVPLLLAHGMKFSGTLLPQLLKLLTAMFQPIPRFSVNETLQQDLLKRIKQRCGADEFFALLVQSVAPIAEKRSLRNLQREDVVLLQVVLSLITLLLEGNPQDAENAIGSFCRNHGIELLLVVINQNYSKLQQRMMDDGGIENVPPLPGECDAKPQEIELMDETSLLQHSDAELECVAACELPTPALLLTTGADATQPKPTDALFSGDNSSSASKRDRPSSDTEEPPDSSGEEDEELQIHDTAVEMEKQFEQKVHDLLENDEQLWKWNCLAMSSIASVFSCVSAVELAQLSFLGQNSVSSPDQLLHLLRDSRHFRDCKKEVDNWRFIARSRNGAMNSNSVLVRLDPNNRPGTVGGRAIGTVSSLFGTRRKDPLENVKDMDLRKRGRFVKGMFQDGASRCDLPLPTKILLAQQSQSFLCFGFEPLNAMAWQRILSVAQNVERAAKEHKETVSGFKNSGERMEMTSPLAPELYREFASVTHYMVTCSSLLHYIREVARLMKQDKVSFNNQQFLQQWQSVSSIVSLDHLEGGFLVLRSFLNCRDLRRRCNTLHVVDYLAELLFFLNLILEKEVVNDPAVDVAAHALASSVLYKEENIKAVFDLLNEYSSRNISIAKSQCLTLFVFSVFQLMDRCSYNGSLLLPKRTRQKGNVLEANDGTYGKRHDDNESVDSTVLAEFENEMVEQMADMINDGDSSSSGSEMEAKLDISDGENDALPDAFLGAEGKTQVSKPSRSANCEGDPRDTDLTPTVFACTANLMLGNAEMVLETEGENGLNKPPSTDVPPLSGEEYRQNQSNEQRSNSESMARAPSEVHSLSVASMASSGRTALSTICSEREVAVGSYLRRLGTTKNSGLLYSSLRHWRTNDADVNLGLTYLMEGLSKEGCQSVFFNVAFLLLFRDVILHGKRTHRPLFNICDKLVYEFFNPSFAHMFDRRAHDLCDDQTTNVLTGAQSFLGFEVALRCGRSLFNFAAADYDVLEEKAMPHLMDYTVIPLEENEPDSTGTVALSHENYVPSAVDQSSALGFGVSPEATEEVASEERGAPRQKKHRRLRNRSSDNENRRVKAAKTEGGANGEERVGTKVERREKKHRKKHSEKESQGGQPSRRSHISTAAPTVSEAAAAEEDRVFQVLMAAIAPEGSTTVPLPQRRGPSTAMEDDDVAFLLQ